VIRRRAQVYWLCQVAGWSSWTGVGLSYALVSDSRMSLWPFLPTYVASIASSIGWTHLYRLVIRKHGWTALGPGKLLARVLPVSVALGIVIPYTTLPLYLALYGQRATAFGLWVAPAVVGTTWCVAIWNMAYFGIHYFERWRQAEVDKLQLAVVATEARLQGLMAQINPHFLFNCLNSVRALAVEDPAKAQTAVTALSELMRYSLQAGQVPTVPLETEIEMVLNYLSLEVIRFDERLTTGVEIDDATRRVQVPPMMVQALVENGVKHGIERLPAGGSIGVSAQLDGDCVFVRVSNTGKITAQEGTTRIGLANARERLRLLYGERARLALREDGGAVIAELRVPVAGPSATGVAA
jgi:hypothetical protein